MSFGWINYKMPNSNTASTLRFNDACIFMEALRDQLHAALKTDPDKVSRAPRYVRSPPCFQRPPPPHQPKSLGLAARWAAPGLSSPYRTARYHVYTALPPALFARTWRPPRKGASRIHRKPPSPTPPPPRTHTHTHLPPPPPPVTPPPLPVPCTVHCQVDLRLTDPAGVVLDEDEPVARGATVVVTRVPITGGRKTRKAPRRSGRPGARRPASPAQPSYSRVDGIDGAERAAPATEAKQSEAKLLEARMREEAAIVGGGAAAASSKAGPWGRRQRDAGAGKICPRCDMELDRSRGCPVTCESFAAKEAERKRQRMATGIPRDRLEPCGEDDPDAMMMLSGEFVRFKEQYRPGGPSPAPRPLPASEPAEVPEELTCQLCRKLLVDTVVVPCCESLCCDGCIRPKLLDSEPQFRCPLCLEDDVTPDDLEPAGEARKQVKAFRQRAAGMAAGRGLLSPGLAPPGRSTSSGSAGSAVFMSDDGAEPAAVSADPAPARPARRRSRRLSLLPEGKARAEKEAQQVLDSQRKPGAGLLQPPAVYDYRGRTPSPGLFLDGSLGGEFGNAGHAGAVQFNSAYGTVHYGFAQGAQFPPAAGGYRYGQQLGHYGNQLQGYGQQIGFYGAGAPYGHPGYGVPQRHPGYHGGDPNAGPGGGQGRPTVPAHGAPEHERERPHRGRRRSGRLQAQAQAAPSSNANQGERRDQGRGRDRGRDRDRDRNTQRGRNPGKCHSRATGERHAVSAGKVAGCSPSATPRPKLAGRPRKERRGSEAGARPATAAAVSKRKPASKPGKRPQQAGAPASATGKAPTNRRRASRAGNTKKGGAHDTVPKAKSQKKKPSVLDRLGPRKRQDPIPAARRGSRGGARGAKAAETAPKPPKESKRSKQPGGARPAAPPRAKESAPKTGATKKRKPQREGSYNWEADLGGSGGSDAPPPAKRRRSSARLKDMLASIVSPGTTSFSPGFYRGVPFISNNMLLELSNCTPLHALVAI